MIKTLTQTLNIDIAYSVNSFLYILRKLPIFRDLMTDDIYKSKNLKKIVTIIGLILSLGKALVQKFIYIAIIYILAYKINSKDSLKSFLHIYTIFSIIGMFINNKLLTTSKKKYFGIILFNIDATKFLRANLFWSLLSIFFLNGIVLITFSNLLSFNPLLVLILLLLTINLRIIGEALNIAFYKKYNYIWYNNTLVYFGILISLILLALLLPFVNVYLSISNIIAISIITLIFSIISLIYLFKVKDYKLIYKKLSTVTNIMDNSNEKAYLKQAMVAVNKKDYLISNKKIAGKKGYDLFNTIFFERHKEILLRSAKKYTLFFIIIYLLLVLATIKSSSYASSINSFLNNKIGWFVIIMYFINRGAIVTQAMFYNCDHAMLKYNFFRKKETILGLFKKRMLTVIRVNLLPASIIATGNTILLLLNNDQNFVLIASTFSFIIILSIFFSVHYLVIYYLLQPFNKNMEYHKPSYTIVSLITYLISFAVKDLVINTTVFSIIGLFLTIIYILVSIVLVYKMAPKTFRLN